MASFAKAAKPKVVRNLQSLAQLTPVAAYLLDPKFYKEGGDVVMPDLLVGLELEIEGFVYKKNQVVGFTPTDDGSLRNNGIEFVSAPTPLKYVTELLNNFFNSYPLTQDNYSERTSVHVHLNCQDLTPEQIAAIALTYQTFERLLFNFVGEDRTNNIFCVPWYQASNTLNLSKMIEETNWTKMRRWQKYTALNLLPLMDRGTIEYRHLYGTCDRELIMRWINIVASIHSYGVRNPLDKIKELIKDLNTSSAYDIFLQDVFGKYADYLKVGNYQMAMEQGIIDSKIMLFDEDKPVPVNNQEGDF